MTTFDNPAENVRHAHGDTLYRAIAPKLKWLLSVVLRATKPPVTPMWTAADVAERLAVHPDSVRRWRVEGSGPPFLKLPSGAVRYDPEEVEAWEAEQRRKSTSDAGERR